MNSKRIFIGLCLVFSNFEATSGESRVGKGCFSNLLSLILEPVSTTFYRCKDFLTKEQFNPVNPWWPLRQKPTGLKPLKPLANFPEFVGQDFKIVAYLLEEMCRHAIPGINFIEKFSSKKLFEENHHGDDQILTLWPGTTISIETINKMSKNSILYISLSKNLRKSCRRGSEPLFKTEHHKQRDTWHLPKWWMEMWPLLNTSAITTEDITSCLVAAVPTIVLVESTDTDGVCELKKGSLDHQSKILVLGIAAINRGNSPEDQGRHLQMLKNMFLLALDSGIEALTIVPPGCGAFGVDPMKMIELIAQALCSLKEHPNFGYFKVYLNAINAANQAIAKEKFESLGLVEHLELILGADILLYADLLAQQAKKEGRKEIVVATIDLLNPDALIGKEPWHFGLYPTHLLAQRTSAITTVELASKTNNRNMYERLTALPSLEDRCYEIKKSLEARGL